jgi:hypothetical protein
MTNLQDEALRRRVRAVAQRMVAEFGPLEAADMLMTWASEIAARVPVSDEQRAHDLELAHEIAEGET